MQRRTTKNAGVEILISDKTDFEKANVTRDTGIFYNDKRFNPSGW